MEFINYTPFPALSYVTVDCNDDEYDTVVMRATMVIKNDGSLDVADKQLPLVTADEYFDELKQGSVRQESDLAPYKPKCDIIVNATAYAPGGQATPHFIVGINIRQGLHRRAIPPEPKGSGPTGEPPYAEFEKWFIEVKSIEKNPFSSGELIKRKALIINGPRSWDKGILGDWMLQKSKPLLSLPVRYEYAYGGENRMDRNDPKAKNVPEQRRLKPEQRAAHPDGPDKAPLAHTVCETNPVGRGFAERWYLKANNWWGYPAPLIESPDAPVKDFDKAYAAQGLGVIGRSWQPRLKLAGTYDEAWLNERHPFLPEDFDFGYWNCAHPDLQVPHLKGNEIIALINLCPHDTPGTTKNEKGNTVTTLNLPKRRIRLTLESESGKFDVIDMLIDTLIIEPEERRVSIVWRRTIPFSAKIAVAEAQVRTLQIE